MGKPERPFIASNVAVLTPSDTRTPATDTSGDLIAERRDWRGAYGRLVTDRIILSQLDARHRPCNLVELLPRIRHE